jgi:chemotaxis protein MotB
VANGIRVEGHTDNVPISTLQFPSNWELSAARAASVVHFLMRLGVAPSRLAAIGFGEHRPVADNGRDEGRQRNRRVTIVVQGASAEIPQPAARP